MDHGIPCSKLPKFPKLVACRVKVMFFLSLFGALYIALEDNGGHVVGVW